MSKSDDDQSKTIRASSLKGQNKSVDSKLELIPQVIIISGPRIGTSFKLSKELQKVTIGRGEADFVITDDTISRRHAALIRYSDNTVYLHDLKSTNGTFLNGVRVRSAKLSNGDKIALGDVLLRFDLLDPLDAKYQSDILQKLTGAISDPLTGLYTRQYFEEEAPKMVSEFLSGDKPLTLLMIDIDYFKTINDTYGHPMGDQVLKVIGATIRDHIRSHDMACRYGGDEIVVMFPDCDLPTALGVAERIRVAVNSSSNENFLPSMVLTISAGIAALGHGESLAKLLDRADQGLYYSKQAGRNRCSTGPAPDS